MSKSIIIYASKDTFVSKYTKDSVNVNFGKHKELLVNKTSKILLYFDLSSIPANATITSAKLSLYLYREYSSPTLSIKRLTDSFNEYKVISSTSPHSLPLIEGDNSKKDIFNTDIGTIITFDNLTKTVSDWYSNLSQNNGFEISAIVNTGSGVANFLSRESDKNDLRPKLEVEYLLNNPNIYTTILPKTIRFETPIVESTIYDISDAIFFTYFINNSIIDPNVETEPEFVNVTLQTCDTKDGPFKSLGDEIPVDPNTTHSIEVFPINKYVRLSLRSVVGARVNISAIYKSFVNLEPSKIISGTIVGDKIILFMSKRLTECYVSPEAFKITPEGGEKLGSLQKVSSVSVLGNYVTLTCFNTSLFRKRFSLTYIVPKTNFLTGINGDVLGFTNLPLTIATPYATIQTYNPNLNPMSITKSPIYDISQFISFKYQLRVNQSPDPDKTISATVSLWASNNEFVDNDFKLVKKLEINDQQTFILPVELESKYRYFYLSFTGTNTKTPPDTDYLSIRTFACAYPEDMPPIISDVSFDSNDSEIIIEMNKPINASQDPRNSKVFTISPLYDFYQTDIQITSIQFLNETRITLNLNKPIPANRPGIPPLILTYKGTATDYFSDEVGKLCNFVYQL